MGCCSSGIKHSNSQSRAALKQSSSELRWTQLGIEKLKEQGAYNEYGKPSPGETVSESVEKDLRKHGQLLELLDANWIESRYLLEKLNVQGYHDKFDKPFPGEEVSESVENDLQKHGQLQALIDAGWIKNVAGCNVEHVLIDDPWIKPEVRAAICQFQEQFPQRSEPW